MLLDGAARPRARLRAPRARARARCALRSGQSASAACGRDRFGGRRMRRVVKRAAMCRSARAWRTRPAKGSHASCGRRHLG